LATDTDLRDTAAELVLPRRQVYALLRRWRQGEDVVSDLTPAGPAVAAAETGCLKW
jgi:hypothetical protein